MFVPEMNVGSLGGPAFSAKLDVHQLCDDCTGCAIVAQKIEAV
jgi:hypothetical protein